VVDDRYRVLDVAIFYKDRIYLVPESTLKGKTLKVCRDSPTTGHRGYFKTYRQIRERFSWKGLKDDVLKHIWECTTCQQNKSEQTPHGVASTSTHSGAEMGEHFYGFYYRPSSSAGHGLLEFKLLLGFFSIY
jgi:hypothetical protein